MARQNQIIALVKGKKAASQAAQTAAYHICQKSDLFSGQKKTYRPKDDEGEQYPGDEQRLQQRIGAVLDTATDAASELFDLVEIQDRANCIAVGSIVVDGVTVLADVPPTYLMFLEHKLVDLLTLYTAIPTLDPAKGWVHSAESNCYRTAPVDRTKTKKTPRWQEVSPATEQHPAQIVSFTEDIIEGIWSVVEFSGAMSKQDKDALIERTQTLKAAVITAREEANSMRVDIEAKAGRAIFEFLRP